MDWMGRNPTLRPNPTRAPCGTYNLYGQVTLTPFLASWWWVERNRAMRAALTGGPLKASLLRHVLIRCLWRHIILSLLPSLWRNHCKTPGHKLFVTFVFKIPGLSSGSSYRDMWVFFTLSLIPGSPSTLVNREWDNMMVIALFLSLC